MLDPDQRPLSSILSIEQVKLLDEQGVTHLDTKTIFYWILKRFSTGY